MRAAPGLRLLRAAVLAFAALLTGAVAHSSADGYLPSLVGLVMIQLGLTLVSAMFLGGPATTARIVLLTIGGQAGVHLVLTMTAGHVGDVPAARAPMPAPMADPAAGGNFRDLYAASRPQLDADAAGPGPAFGHLLEHLVAPEHLPMMLAHAAAAAVVGAWLAVGERALWTLVALAATILVPVLRLAALVKPAPTPASPAAVAQSAPRHLVTLGRSLERRGPPVLLPA